ncbi:HEAT repeat domain-containing protein [Natronoglomus mannanivorans]|uniref:Condensin complex subunit 1 C-terminal domain-containing protein n=1 Tax=Natronoglomus mannanivorans TaxID=2979990 RepID=A0AAP2Z596_9EURY|nr:hypothetical protein [Halobacteria archaeon AArc-xg1-1]
MNRDEGILDVDDLEDALARLDRDEGMGQRERLRERELVAERLRELANERPQDIAEHSAELVAAINEEFRRDYADVEVIVTDFEKQSESIVATLLSALSVASTEDEGAIAVPSYVDLFLELDAEGFSSAIWCLKNVAWIDPKLVEPAVERVLDAMREADTSRAQGAMLCASYLVDGDIKVEFFANHIDVAVDVVASANADDPSPGNRDREFAARMVRSVAEKAPEAVVEETPILVAALPDCEDEVQDALVGTVQWLCSSNPDDVERFVGDVVETALELDAEHGGSLLSALSPVASSTPDAFEPVFSDAETYLVDGDGPVFVGATKLFIAAEEAGIDAVIPHVEAIIGRLDAQEERVRRHAAKLLSLVGDAQPKALTPYIEQLGQIARGKGDQVEERLETTIAKVVYTQENLEWLKLHTDNARLDLNSAKWGFAKFVNEMDGYEKKLEHERINHNLEDTLGWAEAVDQLEDGESTPQGECEPVLHTFLESPEELEPYFEQIVDHLVDGPEVNTDLLWLIYLSIPYWESNAEELIGAIGPLLERIDIEEFITCIDMLDVLDDHRHDVVVDVLAKEGERFQRLCRAKNPTVRIFTIRLVGIVLCEPGERQEQVEPYLNIFAEQCSDDIPWIRGVVAENLMDIADHHPELLVEYVSEINELLTDSDVGARASGLYIAGKLATFDPESVAHLMDTVVESLDHTHSDVRIPAASAFAEYADAQPDAVKTHLDELVPCVRDRELEVKKLILGAFARYVEERSAETFVPYAGVLVSNAATTDDDLLELTADLLTAVAAHSPDRFVEETDGEGLFARVSDGGFPTENVEEAFSRLVALHQVCGTLPPKNIVDSCARETVETWIEDAKTAANNRKGAVLDGRAESNGVEVGRGAVELLPSHPFVESDGGTTRRLDPSTVTDALDAPTAEERQEATLAFLTLCSQRSDEVVQDAERLEARLRDVDPDVRRFALFALCELRDDHREAVRPFADAIADQLDHPDAEARAAACILLRTIGEERLRLLRERAETVASVVRRSNHAPTIKNGTAILGVLARNEVQTNAPIAEAIVAALSNPFTAQVGALAFRDYVTNRPSDDSIDGSAGLLDTAVKVLTEPANRETGTLISILKGLQYAAEREPTCLDGRVSPIAELLVTGYKLSETVERLAIDVLRRVAQAEPESVFSVVETIGYGLENLDQGTRRHMRCIETLHTVATQTSHLPPPAVRSLIDAVGDSEASVTAAETLWELVTEESSVKLDADGIEALVPYIPELLAALGRAEDDLRRELLRIILNVSLFDSTLVTPHSKQLLSCIDSGDNRVQELAVIALHYTNVDPLTLTENASRLADVIALTDESPVISAGLSLLIRAGRTETSAVMPELETVVDCLGDADDQAYALVAQIVVVVAEDYPERISSQEVDAIVDALGDAENDRARYRIALSLNRLSSAAPDPFSNRIDRVVNYFQEADEEVEPLQRAVYQQLADAVVTVIKNDVSTLAPHVEDLVALRTGRSTVQREMAALILAKMASEDVELVRGYVGSLTDGVADDNKKVRACTFNVLPHLAEADAGAAMEHAGAIQTGLDDSMNITRNLAALTVKYVVEERPAAMETFRDAVVARLDEDHTGIAQTLTAAFRLSMKEGEAEPDRRVIDILSREHDSPELVRERTRTLAAAAHRDPEMVGRNVDDLERRARSADTQTVTHALDTLSVFSTETVLRRDM